MKNIQATLVLQGDYTSREPISAKYESRGILVKSLPYPVIRLSTKVFFTNKRSQTWEISLSENGACICVVTQHLSQGEKNEHHDSGRVCRDGCFVCASMLGMRPHGQGTSDIFRWFRNLFSGLHRSQERCSQGRNQWSLLVPFDSLSSPEPVKTENASVPFVVRSLSLPTFGLMERIPVANAAPRWSDTTCQSSKKGYSLVNRTARKLVLDSFAGCTNPAFLPPYRSPRLGGRRGIILNSCLSYMESEDKLVHIYSKKTSLARCSGLFWLSYFLLYEAKNSHL